MLYDLEKDILQGMVDIGKLFCHPTTTFVNCTRGCRFGVFEVLDSPLNRKVSLPSPNSSQSDHTCAPCNSLPALVHE